MNHSEILQTDHEGFVAIDVNVGAEHRYKPVVVTIQEEVNTHQPPGKAYTIYSSIDHKGFIADDLFTDQFLASKKVLVKVVRS